METHLRDVLNIVEAARRRGGRIVLLLYPNLQDSERSDVYVLPLLAFCEKHSLRCIDVSDIAESLPVGQRVVGSNDGHPSAELNRLTADALFAAGIFSELGAPTQTRGRSRP